MEAIRRKIGKVAVDTGFSGAVRVDVGDESILLAYGMADRAYAIANTPATKFATASGTKGFTALTIVRLIEFGQLQFSTTARSLLGNDLPLVDDRVTVEQLLGHTSGIGDYFEEDEAGDINDYAMPVPVHELSTTESYLSVLDGYPTRFEPGTSFSYCNGGYVILGLLAERATGTSFDELVTTLVFQPAGLSDTAFLRSDELPDRVARGYLHKDGLRTNVMHLPVVAGGDGGLYSTVEDIHNLWSALYQGRLVSESSLAEMTRPRSDAPAQNSRYGLGFWLHQTNESVILVGCDAGVSFRTLHNEARKVTYTVMSNTSDGAWPIARQLDLILGTQLR